MIDAMRVLGHEVRAGGPLADHQGGRLGMGGGVGWVHRPLAMLPAVYELMELACSLVAYRKLTAAAAQEFKPDAIYERYNLSSCWPVFMAKRRLGLPLLLEVNAPLRG